MGFWGERNWTFGNTFREHLSRTWRNLDFLDVVASGQWKWWLSDKLCNVPQQSATTKCHDVLGDVLWSAVTGGRSEDERDVCFEELEQGLRGVNLILP
jgi:hypothetical protein